MQFWPGSHNLSCSRLPIFWENSQPAALSGGSQDIHWLHPISWGSFHGLEKPEGLRPLTLTCLWVLSTVSTVLGHAPGGSLSWSQKWVQIGPCCCVETSISELCYENQRGTQFINSFLFIPSFPLLRPTQLQGPGEPHEGIPKQASCVWEGAICASNRRD